MKFVRYLVVVVVVMIFALPWEYAGAQGDDPITEAPIARSIYLQRASAGAFTDNGDGSYILTLQGVGPQLVWLVNSPALSIRYMDAATLSSVWSQSPAVAADAVLGVGLLNVVMTVQAPFYDPATQTQSYVVAVLDIASAEDTKDAPDLPLSFGTADLSMAVTVEFLDGIMAGFQPSADGIRGGSCDQCSQEPIAAAKAALQAAEAAYNAAHQAGCKLGANPDSFKTCMANHATLRTLLEEAQRAYEAAVAAYHACLDECGYEGDNGRDDTFNR